MHLIDIHTHQTPAGIGKLYILNRFPDHHLHELPPGGFYSVGLHPWFIGDQKLYRRQLEQVETLLGKDGVIAVGECGLDKVCKTDFTLQLEVFLMQCEMAESVNKPVIIHCVRAWNDIFHLRRKINAKVPWILHGYSANEMVTRQLIQQDFYFSFGNSILDDKSPARTAIRTIPIDRIFFETDEESHSVSAVYETAGDILQLKMGALAEQIEWNFRKVFVRE
jgi:TatD DNase family protein